MQPKTFVHQLHSILLEPEVNKWIYWSPTDNMVFFLKPYDPNFSTHVLKRYFKHGNVNSFVRQLHMYGFHKLSHPSPDQVSTNNGNVKELVEWKFTHPSGFFFKEANAGVLNKIQRKSTGVGTVSYTHLDVYKRQTYDPVQSCLPMQACTIGKQHL